MFNKVNLISEGDERDMVQQMHAMNEYNVFKKKEDIMSEPRKMLNNFIESNSENGGQIMGGSKYQSIDNRNGNI
tara:strand:+ start:141 stop:362 length:222 start_codon:yes stop_codon:yes gene_type:complete